MNRPRDHQRARSRKLTRRELDGDEGAAIHRGTADGGLQFLKAADLHDLPSLLFFVVGVVAVNIIVAILVVVGIIDIPVVVIFVAAFANVSGVVALGLGVGIYRIACPVGGACSVRL